MKKKQIIENVLVRLEHDPSEADNKVSELEDFWNGIHGLQEKGTLFKTGEQPLYSFEIFSDKECAKFFFWLPKKYLNIIQKKLNSVYSYIEVNPVTKDHLNEMTMRVGEYVESYELKLSEDQAYSLKTKGADKNFLNSLLNSMNHLSEEEKSLVQIVIKPLPNGLSNANKFGSAKMNGMPLLVKCLVFVLGVVITSLVTLVTGGKIGSLKEVKTSVTKDKKEDKEEIKLLKPCFNVSIRIASKSKDQIIARENAKSIASVFSSLNDKNSLRPVKINFSVIKERETGKMKNSAFSISELSQFAHLPGSKVTADNLLRTSIKTPYDKNITQKGIIFGTSTTNRKVAFPMVPISTATYTQKYKEYEKIIDNICKPRLILGQMGTGKSEWIINYAINAANYGVSLILVDPKNDTQKRLIESLPTEQLKKVDYIDLGDLAFPGAMNILRRRNKDDSIESSLIVTSLINFFKKEFSKSWGFAMQQLIQMTGNAILLDEVATLYEFQLMLTNKQYRKKIIDKMEALLADPTTKGRTMLKELLFFWKQFHGMKPNEQRNAMSSTMNKIGVFMANRLIRSIVSQKESYDFRKAGDQGRITIINIPEGILTPENSRLLASFINKAVWLDFQSRASVGIDQRFPVLWLIEEAHQVMDEEFLGVMTKSRGYRLGVNIITQGLTNFDGVGSKELKELILTNCKNKIMFRLGMADAKAMQEEMTPLTPFDMMNIPDYHFYGKILLENGKVSESFFAKALDMANELRSYDEYKQSHKSGKMTIDEIEDELDERHRLDEPINVFNMAGIGNKDEEEDSSKLDNLED